MAKAGGMGDATVWRYGPWETPICGLIYSGTGTATRTSDKITNHVVPESVAKILSKVRPEPRL